VLLHDLLRPAAVAMRSGRKRVPAKRLPRTLARLLALPPRSGAPGYRVLRRSREGAETWQGFAVETDPGILAIVTMVCSADQQFAVPCERECVLLVPHLHSGEDLKNPGLRARLAGTGRLFAVDPRGIGQSMPLGCDGGEFLAHYDADYHFNSLGVMLREPYQGRRVFDVLSTLDWLRSFGYEDIHLAGRGLGAVTALFAAVVDGGLRRVTLVNCLRSYLELTEVHKQRWPHSAMVNGILKVTDLPECLAALGDRVTMVDPWDSQMNPVSPAQG
jgi:pimeloyl-ACP methyl ester carboxylesterase